MKKHLLAFLVCFAALAARAEAASLTLAWDANTESDLAGYVVSYGLQPGVYIGTVNAGLATSKQVTGLTDGVLYYFSVSAYNTAGQYSNPSAVVSGFAGSAPVMSVDTPTDGAAVPSNGFLIAGWALDLGSAGPGVDYVHIWAIPASGPATFVAALSTGGARPDVGAAFGSPYTPSGFGTNVTTLTPGAYTLVVYAHSTVNNTFNNARAVRITVQPPQSRAYITIDTPGQGANVTGAFFLAGWAADFASTSGVGIDAIHVWAYPKFGTGAPPVFAGAAALGGARGDVGGIFGAQFTNSGYAAVISGLPAGPCRLVVYAHSAVTGTFTAATIVDIVIH